MKFHVKALVLTLLLPSTALAIPPATCREVTATMAGGKQLNCHSPRHASTLRVWEDGGRLYMDSEGGVSCVHAGEVVTSGDSGSFVYISLTKMQSWTCAKP